MEDRLFHNAISLIGSMYDSTPGLWLASGYSDLAHRRHEVVTRVQLAVSLCSSSHKPLGPEQG